MRKILLASAAMLTTTAGMAFAQVSQKEVSAPTVISQESAYAGRGLNAPVSAAGANNNNNISAAATPGPTLNPQPGTFVIRLGGRVNVEAGAGWSSIDSLYTAGTPGTGGVTTTKTYAPGTAFTLPAGNTNVVTVNPVTGATTVATTTPKVAGTAPVGAKKNPYGFGTYMRLYPGLDAMATNGLRYGAGTEIRMNSPNVANGSSALASGGASGQLSANTLFVRRAFVYAAGENWGLVRFGMGDGVISLFDGGVTTSQNWSNSGVLNGGDAQFTPANNATGIPFYWMALAGNEYGSNKIVYVSPKLFGVEAGFSYAPSAGNLYTGCGAPNSLCSTLSSSSLASDAGRYTDLYQVGLRYLNDVGPVNVRAYGVYVGSGQVSYTGAAPAVGSVAGYFNNLSVFNAGVAGTFAGFTLGANWIGGAMNGQFGLKPAGGANLNATTVGLQYVTGALTLGVTGAVAYSQGSAALVGRTQLGEQEISLGGRYVVAPGLAVSADYFYGQRKQNGFNFASSAVGADNNQVKGQAVLLGVAVNW